MLLNFSALPFVILSTVHAHHRRTHRYPNFLEYLDMYRPYMCEKCYNITAVQHGRKKRDVSRGQDPDDQDDDPYDNTLDPDDMGDFIQDRDGVGGSTANDACPVEYSA